MSIGAGTDYPIDSIRRGGGYLETSNGIMEWWNNGILEFKSGIYSDFNSCFTSCIEKRFIPFVPIIPIFQYSIIPRHKSET